MENAAITQDAGVQMNVSAQDWPGPAAVAYNLVPMKVEIVNQSTRPLQIRYAEFALVDRDGDRHVAMPPVTTIGTRSYPVENVFYTPVTSPKFAATKFYIAPYLSALYPTLEPYRRSVTANDAGTGTYYDNFKPFNVPTYQLLERAVPEGVLMPGGRLTGWLFFEKIGDTKRVQFTAGLVNPDTSKRFGRISIPFENDAG